MPACSYVLPALGIAGQTLFVNAVSVVVVDDDLDVARRVDLADHSTFKRNRHGLLVPALDVLWLLDHDRELFRAEVSPPVAVLQGVEDCLLVAVQAGLRAFDG